MFNFYKQAMAGVSDFAGAVSRADSSIGTALLEALSLQSINRPTARLAEALNGYSIDRTGNTVFQDRDEVSLKTTAVLSRLLASRPLEEAKMRQVRQKDAFYNVMDRDARQAVTETLKSYIRSGNLDEEKLEKLALDYFKANGSPNGWRSAYRTAIARADGDLKDFMVDKLRDDSPLNYMIDNIE